MDFAKNFLRYFLIFVLNTFLLLSLMVTWEDELAKATSYSEINW